eukprot:scaffold87645_cov41-Prasinocladus_malaysianus.AAC.2
MRSATGALLETHFPTLVKGESKKKGFSECSRECTWTRSELLEEALQVYQAGEYRLSDDGLSMFLNRSRSDQKGLLKIADSGVSEVTKERVDKYLHGLQGKIDKNVSIQTAMKRYYTLNRVQLKNDGQIVCDCKVKRPTIRETESNSHWLLARPLVELCKELPHAKGSKPKGVGRKSRTAPALTTQEAYDRKSKTVRSIDH